MRTTQFDGNITICQMLRDIYAITKRKRIKEKCRIAMAMAKAMDKRLHAYKKASMSLMQLSKDIDAMDRTEWTTLDGNTGNDKQKEVN